MFLYFLSKKDNKEKLLKDFIRNIFGFRPKKLDLYKIALTHRSSSEKHNVCGILNNERLEYLGDAVLSTIVAEFLFKKFPFYAEGPLTEIRSKIVCRDRLNQLSRKIGLNELIMMDEHIHAKSANGDALEALIGAIFLEKGYDKTKDILLNKLILTHLDIEAIIAEENNYKSKILSWAQKQHKKVEFSHSEHQNQSYKKLFKAQLFLDGELLGEGLDYTIKKAEQAAAAKSWEKLAEQNHVVSR